MHDQNIIADGLQPNCYSLSLSHLDTFLSFKYLCFPLQKLFMGTKMKLINHDEKNMDKQQYG